ncbi:hypothetical protein QBC33DRAFT_516994 [Phialemonium atrogriseum]|uniref:DUF7136 domain-containing protein n=1 Tax=Phialemonium atrogriseum TaxID=1093897 RepID=A0AAJ0BXI0_9PEZI|nr:uncharacterized protein QBC33DRAFT_516994 [Phialemonium atrogriseum]KAK1765228.1 hypothetical protein QBC33DRAFT_516994 [Phialemonium atrogriseum]
MSILFASLLLFATTVEGDLVFPRNETYTPSPHSPVVFAVQNAKTGWPIGLRIWVEVRRTSLFFDKVFPFPMISDADSPGFTGGPAPADPALFSSGVNLTGIVGEFSILWTLYVSDNCSASKEVDGYSTGNRSTSFIIAVGGKTPDIAAAVESCPVDVAAVVLDGVANTEVDGKEMLCGFVGGAAAKAKTDPCALRPLSKVIAANVSAAIEMQECLEEKGFDQKGFEACKSEAGLRLYPGAGGSSLLFVALAISVLDL